ncbi:hypothetical protein Scep_030390 [Stephania cephalantha]|uniref:Phytocyanin domain-containing protein n=1 Tax=Stephania cephalantha TaxID=152367 RepID=A0AAP0E765_9MAGN
MALATNRLVVLLLLMMVLMAVLNPTMATVHTVGDGAGWTIGAVDYQEWAASQTFRVGDFLDFQYQEDFHNVLRVRKEQFEACDKSKPIGFYMSGSDSIFLQKTGPQYFICGVANHCHLNMKVSINVTARS